MTEPNAVESRMTEAERIAAEVVRREARRVRTFAFLTIALWVLAVVFIPSIVLPAMAMAKRAGDVLMQAGATNQPVTPQQLADAARGITRYSVGAMSAAIGLVMLTAMLASISTVALALTIRRVTLRQINEGLAQISAQLRDLKTRGG
jgi:hypothetical protein